MTFEVALRAACGLIVGALSVIGGSAVTSVVVFGAGIAVGIVCVIVADVWVRARMRVEHHRWERDGSPERRIPPPRGRRARRLG